VEISHGRNKDNTFARCKPLPDDFPGPRDSVLNLQGAHTFIPAMATGPW
jgi:hypothetical protein